MWTFGLLLSPSRAAIAFCVSSNTVTSDAPFDRLKSNDTT